MASRLLVNGGAAVPARILVPWLALVALVFGGVRAWRALRKPNATPAGV